MDQAREADRFHDYFELAACAIFVASSNGSFLDVNPAACAMFGFRREELLKLSVSDMVADEKRSLVQVCLNRVFSTGDACDEWDFRDRFGGRLSVSLSSTRIDSNRCLFHVLKRGTTTEEPSAEKSAKIVDSSFVDSAPVIVLVLDPYARIVFVNSFFEQITGYRLDEIQGDIWFEKFIPEQDKPRIRKLFSMARRGIATRGMRNPIITRNGDEIDVEWNDQMISVGGTSNHVLAIGVNVSTRVKEEQKSAQLRKLLLESEALSKTGSWEWDFTTESISWSPEMYRQHGLSPADGVVPTLDFAMSRIHSDDRKSINENIERALKTGKLNSIDYRIIDVVEQTRHVRGAGRVVFGENGKPKRMRGCVRDITEEHESRRALEASERRLRQVIDSCFGFIGLFDLDGTLVETNRAPLDAAGLTRGEVIGAPFWETYWWSYSTDIQMELRDALCRAAEGETVRNLVPVRVSEGQLIDIDVVFSPLRDGEGDQRTANGEISGIVGFGVDVTAFTRAEAELRLKDRAIAESLNAFAIAGVDTRLSYVNQAFLDLWGYDVADEVLGVSTHEFWESREGSEAVVEELMATGRSRRERVAIRRDGGTRDVEFSGALVRDESGHPTHMIGSFNDITERKRALSALQEKQEHLRLLIDFVPAGIALLDCEVRYLACSQRWIKDYGLEGQQVIGRSHYDVFPEIPDRWKEIHQRCLQGVAQQCEQDLFERQDGSIQYLRWAIEPWHAPDGSVGGLVFFTEDITGRVQAEEALRVSEQHLAESQRVAHLGNWVWDITADTIVWSDEVYRIFGREPQSFVPRYEHEFLAAIPEEDRKLVVSAVEESLKQKSPYEVTHRIIRPDGSERIVHESGNVQADDDGTPVRMFGVVHDITDRRAAELQAVNLRNQLAHAGRVGTMGELTAGLAHELNQPLTSIHMYSHTARLLLERMTAVESVEPKLFEALKCICDQSLRAGEIVRRMRSFVANQPQFERRCSVNELLSDVLDLLTNELATATVDVELDLTVPISDVLVDPIQIQQVLVNLIQNAIDAMASTAVEKRRLLLSSREEADKITVAVVDSGPGLSQKEAGQVFEAFESTKSDGLGLGLAICRTLIEAHRGTITAGTGSEGGAVFEFQLPVAREGVLCD